MAIFFPSIHPSLFSSLPDYLHEARVTGRSTSIQETYAEDFSDLLRVYRTAKSKQHGAKGKGKDSLTHRISFRFC
jgi:hypothetical protein